MCECGRERRKCKLCSKNESGSTGTKRKAVVKGATSTIEDSKEEKKKKKEQKSRV